MPEERLQKILAQAGLASRRGAEELIVAGRVRVGGRVVTELGTKADASSARIEVDGRRIQLEKRLYVVLHKPRAVVCTMEDPEGRPTVAEYVKSFRKRIVPVGRLDYHTSGVLLLTNDGDFAARMTHPRRKVPKTYVAKVRGAVLDERLEKWRESILIEGRATRPADVERLRFDGDKTWLQITLHEGKNRQIHRLGEHTGHEVLRLARLDFAGINAENLRPGEARHLTVDELGALRKEYGVPEEIRAPKRTDAKAARRAQNAAEKRVRSDQRTSTSTKKKKTGGKKTRASGGRAGASSAKATTAETRSPKRKGAAAKERPQKRAVKKTTRRRA